MRGLKRLILSLTTLVISVASFTDAWIETMREYTVICFITSHLLQMRGLKLAIEQKRIITSVASFTDAWIETKRGTTTREIGKVASFTDAWIETGLQENYYKGGKSHLLQMRGLKHFNCTAQLPISRSHLLQMRGLKLQLFFNLKHLSSRIFYRCVD